MSIASPEPSPCPSLLAVLSESGNSISSVLICREEKIFDVDVMQWMWFGDGEEDEFKSSQEELSWRED